MSEPIRPVAPAPRSAPRAATPNERSFTTEVGLVLFDSGKWLAKNLWMYRRMRFRARRAVVFAPLGVRIMRHVFAPKAAELAGRLRVEPGESLVISVTQASRRKKR